MNSPLRIRSRLLNQRQAGITGPTRLLYTPESAMTLEQQQGCPPFELCMVWRSEHERIIAVFGAIEDEGSGTHDDRTSCKVLAFDYCRLDDGPPVSERVGIPDSVWEQICRVIGKNLVVDRGVRMGAPWYVTPPLEWT